MTNITQRTSLPSCALKFIGSSTDLTQEYVVTYGVPMGAGFGTRFDGLQTLELSQIVIVTKYGSYDSH